MKNEQSATRLSQGLDYYKATMGQLEFVEQPHASVTFALKNRSERLLSEYVTSEQLSARLSSLRAGWQPEELAYLAGLQNQDGTAQFSEAYLDFLADNELPAVTTDYDERGDLAVTTTGAWPLVTFWETVVMSELNELYFANKLAAEGSSLDELYAEGDRRLSEKIAVLRSRPDIHFLTLARGDDLATVGINTSLSALRANCRRILSVHRTSRWHTNLDSHQSALLPMNCRWSTLPWPTLTATTH